MQGWKCSLDPWDGECKLGKGVCNSLGREWVAPEGVCSYGDIRARLQGNCSRKFLHKMAWRETGGRFWNPLQGNNTWGLKPPDLSLGGTLYSVNRSADLGEEKERERKIKCT